MPQDEEQRQNRQRWEDITSIGGPVNAAFMRLSGVVSQLEERTNRHQEEIRGMRSDYERGTKELRGDIKTDLTSIQASVKEINSRLDDMRGKLATWQTIAWILTMVGMIIGGALAVLINVKHIIS